MIRIKKIKYKDVYIPLGMHLSVECDDIPQKLHPVGGTSLTGCKRGVGWHFLPKNAFLTECCYIQLFSEKKIKICK